MEFYLKFIASIEILVFIILFFFALWIGKEYDDLNKFKN